MKTYTKISVLMIIAMFFLLSCDANHQNLLKETEIDWVKEVVGIVNIDDTLLEITNYKCYNDRIYIVDNIAKSIHVYDFSGDYKFSFGSEGSGPGEIGGMEILYLMSDRVVTFDYEKMKYISFTMDGDFISESDPKANKYSFWLDSHEFPDNYFGIAKRRNYVDGKLTEQKILCEFSNDFEIKKELITFSVPKNENHFFRADYIFSHNPLKNIITIPNMIIGDIELINYNSNGDFLLKKVYPFSKINYSEADLEDIELTMEWYNERFDQSNNIEDAPKYKSSLIEIKYNDRGYLWMLANTNDAQNKMYILDEEMRSLGYFKTTTSNFLLYKNMYLESTDESLKIYKYKIGSSKWDLFFNN